MVSEIDARGGLETRRNGLEVKKPRELRARRG
jgi:hypothetical protein